MMKFAVSYTKDYTFMQFSVNKTLRIKPIWITFSTNPRNMNLCILNVQKRKQKQCTETENCGGIQFHGYAFEMHSTNGWTSKDWTNWIWNSIGLAIWCGINYGNCGAWGQLILHFILKITMDRPSRVSTIHRVALFKFVNVSKCIQIGLNFKRCPEEALKKSE